MNEVKLQSFPKGYWDSLWFCLVKIAVRTYYVHPGYTVWSPGLQAMAYCQCLTMALVREEKP